MTGRARARRQLWPRRAPGLPPGQGALATFPRFADRPSRRPPDPDRPIHLTVEAGPRRIELGADDLAAVGPRRWTADFHCVTTWSRLGLVWEGVPLAALWHQLVVPGLTVNTTAHRWAVAHGGDGYRAVFDLDDLLAPATFLAWMLDGEPLDARHGAPLRLVSPSQYGYKSVKHLERIELCDQAPASSLGAKEHPRARVDREERHARVPGRLLRMPYRMAVPLTILVAERYAEPASATGAEADG